MTEKIAAESSVSPRILAHGYTDLPAEADTLEADNYCRGIAEFIETCDTPLTIAIQGDWGTGKSTAIKLIQHHLDRHNTKNPASKIAYSTLNTWQYSTLQEESMLPFYLLVSMYNAILECTGQKCDKETKDLSKHLRDTLREFFGVAAKGTLDFIGNGSVFGPALTATALVARELMDNEKSEVQEDGTGKELDSNKPILLPAEIIKGKITELVEHAVSGDTVSATDTNKTAEGTPSKVERVVLFVDELDRLRPEMAFELLEAMKNFFDCEHCVFVLAVDREVVYRGIEIKYKDSIDGRKKQQFFDKIIQLPFNLPTSQYSTPHYFENLLGRYGIKPDKATKYNDLFVSILQTHNPRSVKRILNLWDLYQLIYGDSGQFDCSSDDENDSRLMLFGLLTLQIKEDLDSNWLESGKTGSDAMPYTTLVEAAKEGSDALNGVLQNAWEGIEKGASNPIGTFAQELGIYPIADANTDTDASAETVADIESHGIELDQSKVDTLQTLLTSMSEMFSASKTSAPDTIYASIDNPALEDLRKALQEHGCLEKRVSKERYDYWKNGDHPTSLNGTVSLRDAKKSKKAKEGDDVHIVFRFDTGEAKALTTYSAFSDTAQRFIPQLKSRKQVLGYDGQAWATLTGINQANVEPAAQLIERFLLG